MTDKRFWEIIKKCEWRNGFDDEVISKKLTNFEIIDEDEIEEFIEISQKKYNSLYEYIFKIDDVNYEKWIDESDDGLNDLITHIIGLGKTTFNQCINDYKEISKYTFRGKNSKKDITRVENFFYSFHGLNDIIAQKDNETKKRDDIKRKENERKRRNKIKKEKIKRENKNKFDIDQFEINL